ncbi:MAG: hypothetical protein WDN69_30155 [Aliidongia sp.]
MFVDIGAGDETDSNTLFFERAMAWRGLCTGATPADAARLSATRGVPCVTFDPSTPGALAELLAGHGFAAVDYCAIESAAASALMAGLDSARFRLGVVTIRHAASDPQLPALMAEKGLRAGWPTRRGRYLPASRPAPPRPDFGDLRGVER